MVLNLKKRLQLYSWARLTEMEAREHTLKYLFWEARLQGCGPQDADHQPRRAPRPA